MTNARLEEYLRSVEGNIAHIPREERETTIREMRSHLQERIAELRRSDAEMGEVEATERAIKGFGDPSDIGVSYGGEGANVNHVVVNNRTGEVMLRVVRATGRVAAATGRGIGRTVKWILFALFALLFLTLGSVLTLLIVFQDDLREATPRPIHSYSRDLENTDGTRSSVFVVAEDVKEIRIHLTVARSSGCAAITIRDPTDAVVFDSTGDCDDLQTLLTFYQPGNWTVDYTYQGFYGHLDVDVYAFERAD